MTDTCFSINVTEKFTLTMQFKAKLSQFVPKKTMLMLLGYLPAIIFSISLSRMPNRHSSAFDFV